jgi:hypothetical protein
LLLLVQIAAVALGLHVEQRNIHEGQYLMSHLGLWRGLKS